MIDLYNNNGGEQGLNPYETCCLASLFLPMIDSKEELIEITKLLYRICKHSLALDAHTEQTANIVNENFRMGISAGGILQALDKVEWLDDCYKALREYDNQYSDQHGFPRSIKLTTIKPDGTLSLLPGITSGVHPGYAHFMKRRIRIASEHPLVEMCRSKGYDVEFQKKFDGTLDHETAVVTFPFSYPPNTIVKDNLSALEQLKYVKLMQSVWSDNAVSCTVYFGDDELEGIKEYLKMYYRYNHKSLSFLKKSNHGFDQAPFEEITEEEYLAMTGKVEKISKISDELDISYDDECAGHCPVR